MNFQLPTGLSESAIDALPQSYVAGGHDRSPTQTLAATHDNRLILDRDAGESGPVWIPWEIPKFGQLITPTGSLMERPRPYYLPLELIRGKLNGVRNQYADWVTGGLTISPQIEGTIRRAIRAMNDTILDSTTNPNPARSAEALTLAFTAAEEMVAAYQDQVFRMRHQRQPKFDSTLGCRLGRVPPRGLDDVFRLTFNSVCIPLTWRQIEPTQSNFRWEEADAMVAWAAERNFRVHAGPLIDFSERGLPDYVLKGDNDPVTLKSLICDYVETVVTRYRGKVGKWLITAGANGSNVMRLTEEDLIRLSAMAADCAWQIDSNLSVTLGIAQPWGEYMTKPPFEFSAWVYADTLLRAGLPFAGLDLEMCFGSGPRVSYARDLLETSKQLDLFGLLGVPLQVTAAFPASRLPDSNAERGDPLGSHGTYKDFSSAGQADWAGAFASLALCKSFVNGVTWDNFSDADPHRYANSGLVDARGMIRPALDRLRELRDKHLR
ncbi:endo-1,4-beta-xylanase [Zavarzinella formosa]|uniref:endo-1,4-beta-xylanase n=1 Tax=Zavarzinella formosa TaxID=360055 RepID=UPI0012FAA167|nr:endo-1,4-beta-xylanase [Zavarzinella formosa]